MVKRPSHAIAWSRPSWCVVWTLVGFKIVKPKKEKEKENSDPFSLEFTGAANVNQDNNKCLFIYLFIFWERNKCLVRFGFYKSLANPFIPLMLVCHG